MNNLSGMGFFGSLFGLSYFSDSGCGGSSGGDAGGGE